MIWRITMYFSGNNQGWSEEFYHSDAQNSAKAVQGFTELAITKRVQFLGKPFVVHAYRISAYSKNDATAPDQPVHFFFRKQFKSTHPSLTGDAEPANVGLQVLMANEGETSSVYLLMGAPPDEAVDIGGAVERGNANLGNDFDNYRDFLISGVAANNCGWTRVGTPVDSKIDSYINNADGKLVLTTHAPHGRVVGTTKYPARIRQFDHGHSNLNGQLLVYATGASEYTSVVKIASFPGGSGGYIKTYPAIRKYEKFVTGELMLQSMKHRRGLPFGSIRGRRPARVRG